MRALATALVSGAMALAAFGLAVAAPHRAGEAAPRAALAAASGAVRIANSRAGEAVFTAAAMRPGQGVSGTVRIGNQGDVPGRFSVRPSGLRDTPGAFGGRLSERMQLVLFDVTNVQQPTTVYAGPPTRFGEVALGTFAPGARRDYLFAATLPDGGPAALGMGDNRYQGSTLSLGLEWRARPVVTQSTPTPTPTPVATPRPRSKPRVIAKPAPLPRLPAPSAGTEPTGSALADALGLPPARACVRRGRLTLRLKAPHGARIRSAKIAVNGRVKARAKGARANRPVKLRRLPRGRIKLRLTIRASNEGSYVGKRVYRGCKLKRSTLKRKRGRRVQS